MDISYDKQAWDRLRIKLKSQFKRRPDIQGVIFLIGHRELGQFRVDFDKSAKQDLLHVGTCALLAKAGFYTFIAQDEDGWPHYELIKSVPKLPVEEQESLLKKLILEYFEDL